MKNVIVITGPAGSGLSSAEYVFEELPQDRWRCDCTCGGVNGYGEAGSKTGAKKKASYMVLVRMLSAAGICKKEWKDEMYRTVLS